MRGGRRYPCGGGEWEEWGKKSGKNDAQGLLYQVRQRKKYSGVGF